MYGTDYVILAPPPERCYADMVITWYANIAHLSHTLAAPNRPPYTCKFFTWEEIRSFLQRGQAFSREESYLKIRKGGVLVGKMRVNKQCITVRFFRNVKFTSYLIPI